MKKNVFLILAFLFITNCLAYAQDPAIDEEKEIPSDSLLLNFRWTFGGNYYMRTENSYHMDIKKGYGGNIGFLFSFTKHFEFEGMMTFYKFDASYGRNIDYKLKGNINHMGLRIYPYTENIKAYTGLFMSWDNFTEFLNIRDMHLEKEYHPSYTSFTIPFGLVYDLSKKIAVDFSLRPGLTFPKLELNRVVIAFNFIFDIEKTKTD